MLDNPNDRQPSNSRSARRSGLCLASCVLLVLAVLLVAGGVFVLIGVAVWAMPKLPESARAMALLGGVFSLLAMLALAVIAFVLILHFRITSRAAEAEARMPIGKGSHPDAAPSAPGDVAALTEHLIELGHTMSQAVQVLKEINENTLLDEPARRNKHELFAQQHRKTVFVEVERLLRERQWARAKALLTGLQHRYADSEDIKTYVAKLAERREKAFAEDLGRTKKNIDDLIAISAWDKAAVEAERLLEQHPDADAAKNLVTAVLERREQFREEQLKRLSAEVQKCVARKRWNEAVQAARQLVEKYPDSPDAAAVEERLPTLMENAEIEKRQQLEEQIRDLVQRHNFVQAEELAKHVIESYPGSPQADALTDQLARLGELARQQEKEIQL